MSEIGFKLREIETPLCEARDLVQAARMAAADLEDDGQRIALQAVLDVAYGKLGIVKGHWMEAQELAEGRTKPDPIFAAIEAHQAAHKAFVAAAETEDDAKESAAEDQAGLKLVSTQPTSFQGAMALLDYFAEVDGGGDEVFPVNARDGDEEFPFATCVVRNAVRALRETVVD
jgi:hypothetical protein